MKINKNNIQPLYKTKKNPKVKDPQRIPNLMEPIEESVKNDYAIQMNKMLADLTVKMVEFSKLNQKENI